MGPLGAVLVSLVHRHWLHEETPCHNDLCKSEMAAYVGSRPKQCAEEVEGFSGKRTRRLL
jgi:hypothetical protein